MRPLQVFLLPSAGGSRDAYCLYNEEAPAGVCLVPLELPGRGERGGEPLLDNLGAMTDDLLAQVERRLAPPYALYGHGLGALLAYLLARRLAARHRPAPAFLLVTGCKGPSVCGREVSIHLLPADAFAAALGKRGVLPPELLGNPAYLAAREAALRADCRAAGAYRHQPPGAPLDVPIHVAAGGQDDISLAEALAWQCETTAGVTVTQYPARHCFTGRHGKDIVQKITDLNQKIVAHARQISVPQT